MAELLRHGVRTAARGAGTLTAPLRGGPDFILVGAKRAGTTSLYYSLLQHPTVLPLFPSRKFPGKREDSKGTDYFDSNFDRGPLWYRSHFPTRISLDRAGRTSGSRAICGEGSTDYLFHPLAPARARAALPDVKIIAMLRNPVQRTFSHFKEQRREGREPLSFEEALAAEPGRIAGEVERIVAGNGPSHSHPLANQAYATQSHYEIGLARWLAEFPREQVLVLISEDFYADPNAEMATVQKFLGLGEFTTPGRGVMNATRGTEMRDATAEQLAREFAPTKSYVEDLLGRSLPWPST